MLSLPARTLAPALNACVIALALAGCATADPMSDTWHQPDATTTLPVSLGGGPLDIDATVVLNADAAPPTFDMSLELAALGLTDVIVARGSYAEDEAGLTLTFTGFVIDPASESTQNVLEDGTQCITLAGFAGTPVCFRGTQTNPYSLEGDTLTMRLSHEIAGDVESETDLRLTRVAE